MAYLINPEDQDLLDSVREFCEKEIKEQCKEYDVSGEWPAEIYAKAAELGYNGLEVPEEYGGLGLERITVAAIMEEFAKADAGFVTTITASNLALKAVLIGGNEEQKQRCCDLLMEGNHGAFCLTEPMAGSDAGNSKTTAVREGDEYVLNGRKCLHHQRRRGLLLCGHRHDGQVPGCQGHVRFPGGGRHSGPLHRKP